MPKLSIDLSHFIDISDFEERSADLRIGDSIFEELAIGKGKVPTNARLRGIVVLDYMDAKRYFYDFGVMETFKRRR